MFSQMNEEQFLRFIWLRFPDSDQLYFWSIFKATKQSSSHSFLHIFFFFLQNNY